MLLWTRVRVKLHALYQLLCAQVKCAVLWAALVFFALYDFHSQSYLVALGVCCCWCGCRNMQ